MWDGILTLMGMERESNFPRSHQINTYHKNRKKKIKLSSSQKNKKKSWIIKKRKGRKNHQKFFLVMLIYFLTFFLINWPFGVVPLSWLRWGLKHFSQIMYHLINHESYKGMGKHVRQQIVIFFGSVTKSIVGSNLNMPSNQRDDLSKKRRLFWWLMHLKFNMSPWTAVVYITSPRPY